MRDLGLTVWYDGKRNIILDGKPFEYPIGEMACAYARWEPTSLKPFIDEYGHKDEALTINNASKAIYDISTFLTEKYNEVVGLMAYTEMLSYFDDVFQKDPKAVHDHFAELNADKKEDTIRDYILKGTGSRDFSYDTLGGMLYYAYYAFSQAYIVYKYTFLELMKDGENESGNSTEKPNENAIDLFLSLAGEHFDFQKISYCILNIEGKFASVYTIRNSLSLLLFEISHVIETKTVIQKCKNCGNYFVSRTRSDAEYCSYPSPQDLNKTCKEIGAQVTRAAKEKNDEFTREYRKAYMRVQMQARRHPGQQYDVIRKNMVQEARQWRKRIAEDPSKKDAALEWLKGLSV